MKDRVNVSIDYRLKQMFEDLQEAGVHSKAWTELVEEATLDFLIKINPVVALEYKLKIEDENQEQRRRSLARTKANIAELEEMAAAKQPDPELERRRDQTYQTNKKYLLRLYKENKLHLSLTNGGPNWPRLIAAGSFKDKEEAEKYFIKRIKGELEEEGDHTHPS